MCSILDLTMCICGKRATHNQCRPTNPLHPHTTRTFSSSLSSWLYTYQLSLEAV